MKMFVLCDLKAPATCEYQRKMTVIEKLENGKTNMKAISVCSSCSHKL